MLNKKLLPFLVACAMILFSQHSFAKDGEISYPSKIAGKFVIGMMNTTSGIIEIPKSMIVKSDKEGMAIGIPLGFVSGMTNMLGRTLVGMLDVISFPIPTKPMITPPVVFQDFSQETTYASGWEMY